ncbi:hypothetical protein LXA43DRAFT_1104099 [Ganoderma leucocontextum]|nr:hypothetical protein LXA43DRAFT_1104099 [Ganoderma leucocontextum]
MFARVAFWIEDGHVPFWYLVPFEPDVPVLLHDWSWIPMACDDQSGFIMLEVHHPKMGTWINAELDDNILISHRYPVVLIRVLGVQSMPLFGYELEALYRGHGYPPLPLDLPETDNRVEENAVRQLRAIVWTESEKLPVVHRIMFNEDNTVRLASHYYLYVDLQEREHVERLIPERGDWEGAKSSARLSVEHEHDTILVRAYTAFITVGLGREIVALDNATYAARRNEGKDLCSATMVNKAPVTPARETAECPRVVGEIVHTSLGFVDIVLPTVVREVEEASRKPSADGELDSFGEGSRKRRAHEELDSGGPLSRRRMCSEDGPFDSIGEASRKRGADEELDSGRRVSRREV